MHRGAGSVTWHSGIDPGSINCGLAALTDSGDMRTQLIELKPRRPMPDRLVQLRTEIRRWLTQFADDGTWCAVVENPVHERGGSTLLAAYGVCVEAASSVLRCPVMTPTNSEWKGHALANGAAKKPHVMTHALLLGYAGVSQDVADAIGCADAARVLTRLNERSAA